MVQWRNSLLLIALFFCGQNLNAADFSVQVGSHVQQVDISGTSIPQIDFPSVSEDANLVFTIDASGWNLQDTESAAFGFSIERHDKESTVSTDEYRRALMVVRPLKVENGVISLLPDTEVRGWGWKYLNQGELAWRTVSNQTEVAQYISINGQSIVVDYHNLRTAAGLSAVSNPNDFDWEYRLLWSDHLSQGSLQPLSASEVIDTWLPISLDSSFTDPLSQGYGVNGRFTVGQVAATNVDVQLNPGWNLIELPYTVSLGTGGIPVQQLESVWQIDVTSGGFTQINPQEISMLQASTPYWVKLSINEVLTLSGVTMLEEVRVTEGPQWNLVSVASNTAVSSIYDQLSTQGFWYWDGEQWMSALSGVPTVLNGFDVLQPGSAYYYK